MKRITAFLIFIYLFIFASPVFAASVKICDDTNPTFGNLCKLSFENFGGIVGKIIILLLIIAVVIAVFFLIYGGIKWITSGGDKSALESARGHIVAAIVGLIISLLAFFIINFIGKFFGLTLVDINLPQLP